MNPLYQAMAGGVVRYILITAAGSSVLHLAKQPSEADLKSLAEAIVSFGALGWSLYQKYKSEQVTVTALASTQPMSRKTAEAMIASPLIPTPSAATPADVVPVASKQSDTDHS